MAGPDDDGNGGLQVNSKTGTNLIYAGAGTEGNGQLWVLSKTGTDLVKAGANADGGLLTVKSKTGTNLIGVGAATDGTGFLFEGYNKTGEVVVNLFADEYGNGVVWAGNRKGEGWTLKPGP